jgi:hypothetical protein
MADLTSRATARRHAWVELIGGVPDPERRGMLARQQLAAAQRQLRAVRGQAARDLFATHRNWAEVGRRLGVKREVARRWGMAADSQQRSA